MNVYVHILAPSKKETKTYFSNGQEHASGTNFFPSSQKLVSWYIYYWMSR